jgi:hypothetical protein
MELPKNPLTEDEFYKARKDFLAECEKSGSGSGYALHHKKCGGLIRKGFMNLFEVDPSGALTPGRDGFGLGPVQVPYCENCDPPQGFNYTYNIRVGILGVPGVTTA